MLEEILADETFAPLERLRRAAIAFFRSERQEAALRRALDDAGAPFRDSPEASAHSKRPTACIDRFLNEAAPDVQTEKRRFLAEFLMISMGSVAEKITERGLSRAQVDAWEMRLPRCTARI